MKQPNKERQPLPERPRQRCARGSVAKERGEGEAALRAPSHRAFSRVRKRALPWSKAKEGEAVQHPASSSKWRDNQATRAGAPVSPPWSRRSVSTCTSSRTTAPPWSRAGSIRHGRRPLPAAGVLLSLRSAPRSKCSPTSDHRGRRRSRSPSPESASPTRRGPVRPSRAPPPPPPPASPSRQGEPGDDTEAALLGFANVPANRHLLRAVIHSREATAKALDHQAEFIERHEPRGNAGRAKELHEGASLLRSQAAGARTRLGQLEHRGLSPRTRRDLQAGVPGWLAMQRRRGRHRAAKHHASVAVEATRAKAAAKAAASDSDDLLDESGNYKFKNDDDEALQPVVARKSRKPHRRAEKRKEREERRGADESAKGHAGKAEAEHPGSERPYKKPRTEAEGAERRTRRCPAAESSPRG